MRNNTTLICVDRIEILHQPRSSAIGTILLRVHGKYRVNSIHLAICRGALHVLGAMRYVGFFSNCWTDLHLCTEGVGRLVSLGLGFGLRIG